MADEIVIEIDHNGHLSADVTDGPGGAECEKELNKLLSGLGKQTVSKKKAEYYRKAKTRTRTRNKA